MKINPHSWFFLLAMTSINEWRIPIALLRKSGDDVKECRGWRRRACFRRKLRLKFQLFKKSEYLCSFWFYFATNRVTAQNNDYICIV